MLVLLVAVALPNLMIIWTVVSFYSLINLFVNVCYPLAEGYKETSGDCLTAATTCMISFLPIKLEYHAVEALWWKYMFSFVSISVDI